MGLLSKANLLDTNKRLAFSNFISDNNISQFAIFSFENGNYYISNSLGFDGISIINSISTSDFWNGICKINNEIYRFDYNSENPLLQFFSFNIKDEIKFVSVVKTENNKILLLCNKEISQTILKDFLNFDENTFNTDISKLNDIITKESYLPEIEIDFEEAVNTFIYTKKKSNKGITDNQTKAVLNELINRIFFYYNNINASLRISDYKIKTVFVCDKNTPQELLFNHLILNFKDVIDNSAEIINLDFTGNAESFQDIQIFLKEE